MTNQDHFVAAIDLGTTKIVTIIGKMNSNGKMQVVSFSSAPSTGIKRGVVLNIEETVLSIQRTVEEAQTRSGVIFDEVFVGIAGQHIRSVRNRGYINRISADDVITIEDVKKLMDDMYRIPVEIGEEILHVLPQSFTVDNETDIKSPIGMSGRRLEGNFHIVIGNTQSTKHIERCIERVGLQLNELLLEPLASSEAVLTEDEKEAGVVLVDIGGGTTDVTVCYDGIIRHTAVIPLGGNVVTNDIKEGCQILQRQAEQLKVQFGSSLGDMAPDDKVVTIPGISGREPKEISFRTLAYIIQSRMEEIIGAVWYEVENSGYADRLGAGIVLTGGGSLLRNLPQLIKYKTGLDVRIGFPSEHLASDSPKEVNTPNFSTAIGLLLMGFDASGGTVQEESKKVSSPQHQEPASSNPQKKKSAPKGKKILERLKNGITNIFEENDSELQ